MPSYSARHTIGSLDLATLLRLGGEISNPVTQLCVDSQLCQENCLFFALAGSKHHGIQYAQQAVKAGAQGIITDWLGAVTAMQQKLGIPILVSENPRHSLAIAASRFYARQPAKITAVTGTNGKTSVAHFTMQIMQQLGLKASSFGTLGLMGSVTLPHKETQDARLTTPPPIQLHRLLGNLTSAGCEGVAMEASSHGLQQNRLDGVRLTAAALTNITRDHLDYHESPEAYVAAKMHLFSHVLPPDGKAVLNIDDPSYMFARSILQAREIEVLTYGVHENASLRLLGQSFLPQGQRIDVQFEHADMQTFELPLVGDFQAMNVLAAAGLVIASGYAPNDVLACLPYLTGVKGRMENVEGNIYVDYAHTPDALATALQAIRPHVAKNGKLYVLFGAGGDRDTGKRPLMGKTASEYADIAMVTDDNPRSENPEAIRQAIIQGAPSKIVDCGAREQAIAKVVNMLTPDDILVIAGKGHETTQEIQGVFHDFDDRVHIRYALGKTRVAS